MKRCFGILVVCLLFVSGDYAQTWAWAKSGAAGGTGAVSGRSVASDSAGNVYATGYFNTGTLTFGAAVLTNDTISKDDVYLVKYDGAGTVLWARSAGGKGNDEGYGICVDRLGNVYICGAFDSPSILFGATTLTNSNTGTKDLFLVKYDGSGNVIWAKNAGGPGNEHAFGVSVDPVGNSSITGDFSSASLVFGTDTVTNTSPNANVFTANYDPSGNVIWAKSAGGSQPDSGNSICSDTAGNVCITGAFSSPSITFGTVTLHNLGVTNFFVVKYSPAGIVLWAKSYGASGPDQGNGISADKYGEFYVCGTYSSASLHFDSTAVLYNTGNSNIFLIKFGGAGQVRWARTAGGASQDAGYGVCAFITGTVFLCGSFDSFYMNVGALALNNANPGTADAFIAEYDGGGTVLFAKSVGGAGNELARGVGADRSGNASITGDFSSASVSFGSSTVNSTSSVNMFAAKMDGISGIQNLLSNHVGLSIYPNPASEYIIFEFSEVLDKEADLILYTPGGQTIKKIQFKGIKSFRMERENLPSGLYLYTLSDHQHGMLTSGKLVLMSE